AYLRPVVAPYLARLERELGARLRVMQSNGGATIAAGAARHPVRTVLSGPAAGVVGALAIARAAGCADGITLDMGGTPADVALLAARLGRDAEGAAEDIVAVADAVMARAIKAISVERGVDPAPFTLLAFGGAGALHACAVARELELTRVLVPPAPGLLCAYGA